MKLEAADIRAMRRADEFIIRHENGRTTLELIAPKMGTDDTFPQLDVGASPPRRIVDVEGDGVARWGMSQPITRAFFSGYAAFGAFRALALLSRAGDTLRVEFRENGNGYLEGVRDIETKEGDKYWGPLKMDEACAVLRRTDKSGRTRDVVRELVIGSTVCPSRSMARGIIR